MSEITIKNKKKDNGISLYRLPSQIPCQSDKFIESFEELL